MNGTEKLSIAIWEADRHVEILDEAMGEWNGNAATDWKTLASDRGRIRLLDQLLFRFIKLQDTIGERLIPATLSALGEPFEDWPMRDRLNRLEKLGFLDTERWLSWREIRNRLAHEYPDQPELRFAALLAAIDSARALSVLYREWRQRLETTRGITRHDS